MQKHFHLCVSTDLNEVAQVLAWLEACKPGDIPERTWLEFQTALVEGFTNVIRHAHQNHPPITPIDIDLELSQNCITAQIWDFGPTFDLNAKLAEVSLDIDTENDSGRGLRILKSVADRLNYRAAEGNRNCLSIIKYYTTN